MATRNGPQVKESTEQKPMKFNKLQIEREPATAILAEYTKPSKSPADRTALFRKQMSARIRAGEDFLSGFPVSASNTLGNLSIEFASQIALEDVGARAQMLAGVATDFAPKEGNLGDLITSRIASQPTAKDFGEAPTDVVEVDVPVTLDKWREASVRFAPTEVVGSARHLVLERGESLAIALGNDIFAAVTALITETAFGDTAATQTIKAAETFDHSTLRGIAKAMTDAGVPPAGRFGWISSDVATAACADEIMTLSYDRKPDVSDYAHWSACAGFRDIWEVPSLPTNDINLIGFFGARSSLVCVCRVPRHAGRERGLDIHATYEVMTDPRTGLSFVRNVFADSGWNLTCRMTTLFGVAVGNPAVGHTLVSAA